MGINFSPDTKGLTAEIKLSDFIAVSAITHDWAESYDTKNWEQLRGLLTPQFEADYIEVIGEHWKDLTPDDFIEKMKGIFGNPLLRTHHLIGASKWTVVSETEILGNHQIRAAHQKFKDADLKAVEAECNCHGKIVHHYSLVDGEWKLSGLRPSMYWLEPGFEKVMG